MSVALLPLILLLLFVPLLIGLTAVLFTGWMGFRIVRALFRGLNWTVDRLTAPPMNPPTGRVFCGRGDCRANNPSTARFCRRCGRKLPALEFAGRTQWVG